LVLPGRNSLPNLFKENIMFSIFAKSKQTETSAPKPLTDELAEQVLNIVETVGLGDNFGFKYHLTNEDSYNGGYFEWTDNGVRFWAYKNLVTGKVYEAHVTKHSAWTRATQEQLDEANQKLAQLFA
jgi:hypothetical protein